MIRFTNPYFLTGPAQKAAEHKAAVDAWLKTQVGNKVITIAELRAGVAPAVAADLTRAVVNQILADLGAVIENPEDQGA